MVDHYYCYQVRVHIIFAHQLIAMVEDGFDGGSDGQQDDGLKV